VHLTRMAYLARSFVDCHVPVHAEFNDLYDGYISFIVSKKWAPGRAMDRLREAVWDHAVFLVDE
jgi:hypothetical protein